MITELPAVSLAPGQYLLVQEAQGTGGTTPLPAPDVTDGTPIAMSAKVALVNSTTPLGSNGGSTPCGPAALAMIVDLVGYGSANFFEGTGPTPAPDDGPGRLAGDVEFKSANHVNTLHDPGPYRASDLDPVLVGLCQPPSLSVSASPSALFPPNHKYVTVKVAVAASADVAAVSLVSATSNEPDNGLGDGDTSNDIVIVDGRTLKLRAERSGRRGGQRVRQPRHRGRKGDGAAQRG